MECDQHRIIDEHHEYHLEIVFLYHQKQSLNVHGQTLPQAMPHLVGVSRWCRVSSLYLFHCMMPAEYLDEDVLLSNLSLLSMRPCQVCSYLGLPDVIHFGKCSKILFVQYKYLQTLAWCKHQVWTAVGLQFVQYFLMFRQSWLYTKHPSHIPLDPAGSECKYHWWKDRVETQHCHR